MRCLSTGAATGENRRVRASLLRVRALVRDTESSERHPDGSIVRKSPPKRISPLATLRKDLRKDLNVTTSTLA
jgi:hypothetical protein